MESNIDLVFSLISNPSLVVIITLTNDIIQIQFTGENIFLCDISNSDTDKLADKYNKEALAKAHAWRTLKY